MMLLARLRTWLRAILHRSRTETDMDAELRSHIESYAEDLVRTGLPRTEALRRARLEFGGLERVKEECRESRGISFIESLAQDLRFGLRMLRKSPGFTTVAVLTLALGIGANTAIFSLLDGLILRDLPVPHPEQLVHFGAHTRGDNYANLSLPMFQEISRDQRVFSSTFAWDSGGVFNVQTNGQFSHAEIWFVTGNFYSELGAVPEIGRLIDPSDVNLSTDTPVPVAVLGYGFWKRYYGGGKDVIGKIIKIEDVPFSIVGVSRQGFKGMAADGEAEVVLPLTAEPLVAGDQNVQKSLEQSDVLWLDAAGRLKPTITLAQARADLDSLWPSIRQAVMPAQQDALARVTFSSLQMAVESYATGDSAIRTRFLKPIYVLLAISGVVLLLACMNLASLLLSRAAVRGHEFGIRVALGASHFRLVRQVLTESLMISIAGTLAGFALASWGSRALSSFILGQIYIVPAALNLSPDLRILSFTAAAAILTGALFGLAPAWRAAREDPNSALQQGPRARPHGTGKLGKGLIVTQIALSIVLLAGAGLFIRTFGKLRAVQPGFRIRDILEVHLFPLPNAFNNADPASYFRDLTNRISALPGVTSAGFARISLGDLLEWRTKIQVPGQANNFYSPDCEMVMPGFFRTENISLIRGRTFQWSDNSQAPRVAVVSEDFAKEAFPHGDAIGQRIDFPNYPSWQSPVIVGIVSNTSLYDIRKPPQPTVYVAAIQAYNKIDIGYGALLVRTNLRPTAILPAIQGAFEALGREAVESPAPLAQSIDYRSLLHEYITAVLSAFFGALALLIAGIGLFGLMAYSVAQRTRELGIRFALGAQRGAVLRMVLRETLTLALIGILLGLPCALAATRLIAHMLFGVTPYDPITLTAVALALLAVGALAGYIPARRAMRVDPMVALRYE